MATFMEAPVALLYGMTTAGFFQLSFVHSGYTEEDVDGKSALLNAVLEVGEPHLSDSEISKLLQRGILDGNQQLHVIGPITDGILDVRLPADVMEEARIRKTLSLPKPLKSGAKFPIQVKWDNVNGSTLYDWLTTDKGLKFVYFYKINVSGELYVDDKIPEKDRQNWWSKINGSTEVMKLAEGVSPVALDITKFYLSKNIEKNHLLTADAARIYELLRKFITSNTRASTNGELEISKDDFLSTNWKNSSIQLSINSRPGSNLSPGQAFLIHPNLVKDLSGNGVGLDALRN